MYMKNPLLFIQIKKLLYQTSYTSLFLNVYLCRPIHNRVSKKRSSSLSHTLWVIKPYKITSPKQVDIVISAEIPDAKHYPNLYKIVTELMMHGPCGHAKRNAPCMANATCSKHFPKQYEHVTRFDKNGYVHYRRRDDGTFTKKTTYN